MPRKMAPSVAPGSPQDLSPIERPAWAVEIVGLSTDQLLPSSNSSRISCRVGREFTLVTACLKAARYLDADGLRQGVEQIYESTLSAAKDRHLVRVWNFIPGLLEPLGDLPQRYMVFNSARVHAYSKWYGGLENLKRHVPAASGIGTDSDDLVVHALAASRPGVPVENPRQISSYRYSEIYGPLPPCFARATRIELNSDPTARLLVAGTASIRGESTLHLGDIYAQIDETLDNLASVIGAGLGLTSHRVRHRDRQALLGKLRHLRVYIARHEYRETVTGRLRDTFPNLADCEVYQADLCREGLLVEIEGWAALEPLMI